MNGRKNLKSEDKFAVDEQHLSKSTTPHISKPTQQTNVAKNLPKKEAKPQLINDRDEESPSFHETQKHARFTDLHAAYDMQDLPGSSGYYDPGHMTSSESAAFVKNLLPGTHKRRSTLISRYKMKSENIDYGDEVDQDLKIGMDSSLPDKEPRQLLAAIRTLPVRMNEKRDYRFYAQGARPKVCQPKQNENDDPNSTNLRLSRYHEYPPMEHQSFHVPHSVVHTIYNEQYSNIPHPGRKNKFCSNDIMPVENVCHESDEKELLFLSPQKFPLNQQFGVNTSNADHGNKENIKISKRNDLSCSAGINLCDEYENDEYFHTNSFIEYNRAAHCRTASLFKVPLCSKIHENSAFCNKSNAVTGKIGSNEPNITCKCVSDEGIKDVPMKFSNCQRTSRIHNAELTANDIRYMQPKVINEKSVKGLEILNHRFNGVQRKCWSRICWSQSKHSHPKRDRLLQATLIPENEMPYLDLVYFKAKRKIPKFFKELLSKCEIWSLTFKLIEGKFGTGVVSYFVFLRWLLMMNVIIFLITLVFIILPQALGETDGIVTNVTLAQKTDIFETSLFKNLPTPSSYSTEPKSANSGENLMNNFFSSPKRHDIVEDLGSLFDTYAVKGFVDATLYYSTENYTDNMRRNLSKMCSHRYEEYLANTTDTGVLSRIQDMFQGTGWLEYTLLFMGYYTPGNVKLGSIMYNMSIAFIVVLAFLLLISVIMMVSYSSSGVQESMLQSNLHEMYCYNVFCGWDFCIAEEKTAKHHHDNILQELSSTLSEERRKAEIRRWTQHHKIRVYSIRCLINLLTVLAVVGSYYLFFYIAKVQLEVARTSSNDGLKELFYQFLPSITITTVNFSIPLVLYLLVGYEEYTTRSQINITLVRVILLRQASIIMLLSSFYDQIGCSPRDMCDKGFNSCTSPLCWETYVGQQMYRLAVLDLIVHICTVFFWETPRTFMYKKWKNQYTEFVGKQLFDIPTQVLALVYSQTLCWLGMFYCPLLPAITVAKYIILFYIKRFTVIQNYAPEQIPYRASRSNAIFGLVLLLSFFVTIAVLGYSVTQFKPSPGCGPYRLYDHILHAVKNAMDQHSSELNDILLFMLSPLFIVPIIILLCLAMYYYVTKASAHKKMVKLLKVQLTMEGTDKQFLLKRVTNIKPRTEDLRTRKEK